MAKALTEREYAAWRRAKKLSGATRKSVQEALKSGRIKKNEEGLIDPEAADSQWEANTSKAKQRKPPAEARPGAVPSASSYSEARAVREALNARLTKIMTSARMVSVGSAAPEPMASWMPAKSVCPVAP